MLGEAARDNDNVRVWILPAGAHGILEAIDSTFTYNVYRGFFERWAALRRAPAGLARWRERRGGLLRLETAGSAQQGANVDSDIFED